MEKLESSERWDPLEAVTGSDREILTAAKKREIKNILKSYVGTYDPMSELIQNAMDSVEKRLQLEEPGYEPKIWVNINLPDNSFEILDNGVGFNRDEFRSFLAPNISFKESSGSRGNKGVGATYIAYGFNHLEVSTKNDSFKFFGKFRNGRRWVDDTSGVVYRPYVEELDDLNSPIKSFDSGASFKIKFGGENTRPANLSWYQAVTPEQWLYLLLIKTPLGHVDLPTGNASKVLFDISVVKQDGEENCLLDCFSKYKFPHEEIKASVSLEEVKSLEYRAVDLGKNPSAAIEKFKGSNGIYDFFSTDYIYERVKLSEEERDTVINYSVTAYGYFSYSTSIWDRLNDDKAKLRKGYRVLRGGLQLANNHMVQGELITIPLTKSIGHQNQSHVIVHFDGADPDLGRKGFQPELKELAEKIGTHIVGYFSARRDLLKGDTGEAPDIEKELKVHEWLRNQELHEKEHPLLLSNENFFLPTKKISVQSEPLCEQDTIVLFNQLLAGGVIRGIRLLSTSQVSQYDGIFRYVAEKPFENLVFDAERNPLGVFEEQLAKEYVGPPKIIEYKFNLDGLIREFESDVKSEGDVSLAVFWDFGEEYKKEYGITSLLDFDNIHKRKHHGITHILRSANTSFDAICLKELISLLNDPSEQQQYQKNTYSDDI